jgi:glycosyltransferase involved in cell wall biosynthesis
LVLITFVGSFAVYQGVDLLIKTIPEVVKNCPLARFIIIGGKDDEIEKRKTVLKQQGALDAVSFIGMVAPDVLPDYLSASDILLSPRISGVNTPLKLLDYLKAGRSIVATDVESNRLILDDDLASFAAPEPTAMAAVIISLVENTAKREAMGKKGRKLYENKYNFPNFTKKLKACYEFVQADTP